MNKLLTKMIALLLSVSFVLPLISGCNKGTSVDVTTEPASTAGWQTDHSSQPTHETTRPSIDVVVSPIKLMSTSIDDWEAYLGDIETFVYGLIISALETQYSVFPGYVCLENGLEVYGIAYTDYNDCYTNESGSEIAFTAGFLPFVGEIEIPEDDYNSGLVIHDLDYASVDTSFILTYMSDPFKDHCVVYGKYLIYGVDETGGIFYSYSDYVERQCDESIGSLYSYDEERELYISPDDVGNYISIGGESLSSQIDFVALEKEINEIIEKQDFNFKSIDIESCAFISQEAVKSYLLSLQEETFLGYSVTTLVEIAENLDPKDCIRITDSGLSIVTIEPVPEKSADALTKWLVGTGCVIVAAVGCVASIVFIECPPLSSLASAMMGTAIELFMQVVINETALENINWTKVAISAAIGAVSGFLGPYVMAATKGTSYAVYFIADSAIDGLLGGIETTVLAVMEGKQGADLIKSFGVGFALGFAISGAFKAVGKVISKAASKISSVAKKIMPNLTKKISKISDALSKGLHTLKVKADGTVFHSKYLAEKFSSGALIRKSFNALESDDIFDNSGKSISKEQLRKIYDTAAEGSTIGFFERNGYKISIIKQNGMVSIQYPEGVGTTVNTKLTNNRDTNFINGVKELQSMDSQGVSTPELQKLKSAVQEKYPGSDFDTIEPQKILNCIKDRSTGLVFHENIDLNTMKLIDREIHDNVYSTGINHMGGYALIDYLKTKVAEFNFERIVQAISSWTAAQVALEAGE